ncbi:hypothetical protein GCM10011376_23580 [Nocardioides flavus (ex Wang et al. 2016)]|uniref:Uncharacterized protein n=1 Tax=Nocardioides flavus (ex Wang et al. 2016) TaxID=2058780 RepID=A0ABQ3HLG3_9ACTN|nr:hypothetical protein GCM10011376_23580 [Nocardioides flavus (ex Wang et al. 2016)]
MQQSPTRDLTVPDSPAAEYLTGPYCGLLLDVNTRNTRPNAVAASATTQVRQPTCLQVKAHFHND